MVGTVWANSCPGCMDRLWNIYSHLIGHSFLAGKALGFWAGVWQPSIACLLMSGHGQSRSRVCLLRMEVDLGSVLEKQNAKLIGAHCTCTNHNRQTCMQASSAVFVDEVNIEERSNVFIGRSSSACMRTGPKWEVCHMTRVGHMTCVRVTWLVCGSHNMQWSLRYLQGRMVGRKAEKRKERGKTQVREEARGRRFYKLNSVRWLRC